MPTDNRDRFLTLLRAAVQTDRLAKLTLGRRQGGDPTLKNVLVRPVRLKSGPRLGFTWRHTTRDVAKNLAPSEGLALLESLVGTEFLDAHLFTPEHVAHLECQSGAPPHLRIAKEGASPAPTAHDRVKSRLIPPDSRWLQALGVTDPSGRPREGMAPKFRQIQKFAELLAHLLAEAHPPIVGGGVPPPEHKLKIVDMGCGKGYLTFAVSALLGEGASVRGIEVRPDLVEACNKVASDTGFSSRLSFSAGTIAGTALDGIDVLIALHACDTATDDAIAKGVAAGAALIMVSPCCQKELRPQIEPAPVLAAALRHGIFREWHAEFATDALRAMLLEWAGYRAKVFEFVSTEHTAKNLMITAVKAGDQRQEAIAGPIRDFARFYGITRHALARHLGFDLSRDAAPGCG